MGDSNFSLRRIAIPAFGPTLLFGIGEGAILPVVALSARELGATVALAALIVTLIGIGSLLSNVPAALLTSTWGERWAIVIACLWAAIAAFICIISPNVLVFAGGIFMIGMGLAVLSLARQSYLTEAVPIGFRARALSTLGGVMRIGVFIGPFIGAGIIHFWGLSAAYGVAIVAFVASGAVAIFLPDLPAQSTKHDEKPPSLAQIAKEHLGVFVTIGLGVVLVAAVRAARQVAIPLWADQIEIAPAAASIIYGLSGAVDMLVFYPAGKVMDAYGRQWVAIPSMVIMGISLIAMPFTHSFVSLLIISLCIGFGNGIGSGMIMTLGADFSPDIGRAQFLGIWRLLSDLGATAGPAILSVVTAAASLGLGLVSSGVLGLIAAVLLGRWIPHRPIAIQEKNKS